MFRATSIGLIIEGENIIFIKKHMQIIEREYRNNEEDFLKIRNLLIESYTIKKSFFNWGVARWDIVRYRVQAKNFISGEKNFLQKHHLWETEEGKLVGTTLTENNDHDLVIIVHPDFEELEDRMFDWAEKLESHSSKNIKTCVYAQNEKRQELLKKRGYKKHSEAEYMRSFDLSKDIKDFELPKGFTIRNVHLLNDFENRINVHQNAFENKGFDLEAYKLLRQAPGYQIENDLVIVSPDGQFVCFCVVWVDDTNNFAEIEPFGTHSEFRNIGLGKALLTDVLKRLKARNLDRVYISSGPEPALGNRLYESVGFSDKRKAYWWIKDL